MLELARGDFRVVIDDEKGGEIVHLGLVAQNMLAQYDWPSPVPASQSRSYGSDSQDWLSEYRGGWQSLFPNAGPACVVQQVPLPFHGEWSRSRLATVSHSKDAATLVGAARLPLKMARTYSILPDVNGVRVTQEVVSEADVPVPFIWGEHPAFAPSPGAVIHLPRGPIHAHPEVIGLRQDIDPGQQGTWPHLPGDGVLIDVSRVPSHPMERLCYLPDRPAGWAVITDGDLAIGLAWDTKAFPHLWLWQQQGGTAFPWYGRAAITAIEPASHWPAVGLADAVSSGQAMWLLPGEAATSWFTIASVQQGTGRFAGVDKDGHVTNEARERKHG